MKSNMPTNMPIKTKTMAIDGNTNMLIKLGAGNSLSDACDL